MSHHIENIRHRFTGIGYENPVQSLEELKEIDPQSYYALITAQTIDWLANQSTWSNNLSFHTGICGGIGCERGGMRRSHHDVDIAIAEADMGFIGMLAMRLGQHVYQADTNLYQVMVPLERLHLIGGPHERVRFKKIEVDFLVFGNRDGMCYNHYGKDTAVAAGPFPFAVQQGSLLDQNMLFLHPDYLKRLKEAESGMGRLKSRFDLETLHMHS